MLLDVQNVPSVGKSHNRHKTAFVAQVRCDQCLREYEVRGCPRIQKQRYHFCSRSCSSKHQSQSPEFSQAVTTAIDERRTDPIRRQAHSDTNSQRMNVLYATRPEIRERQSAARAKRWQDPSYRQSMTGSNHPNSGKINPWWQPWMERELEGRLWVSRVKQLFSRRCALCNSRTKLHAHHIIPRSSAHELTLDLNNGIALCHNCHEGKDNLQNVHRLLREDSYKYLVLMQELLLRRKL